MSVKQVLSIVVFLAVGIGGGIIATNYLLDDHDQNHKHSHEEDNDHEIEDANHHGQECEISPQTAKTIGLKTHTVDFGPVEDVIELLGTVAPLPDQHHIIASRTSGQALHIHAQVGQAVKKGDILIEIDSAELARNIFEARRMEADYQKLLVDFTRTKGRIKQLGVERKTSEESAQLAEAEYKRLKSAENAVSLNVLNTSKAAALQARARVEQKAVELEVTKEEAKALAEQTKALRLSRDALLAVANVDPSQIDQTDSQDKAVLCDEVPARLSIVRLRSPIEGVVVERGVSPGQGVEAGQSLMVVANYNHVQVHGELPESLISKLRQDKPVKVRVRPQSESQQMIEGRMRFISPVIDPVKRTAHLIVDVPNPDRVLRDGAFVTLTVVLRDMTSQDDWPVVVPVSAVLREGPAYYVFKQVTPNKSVFKRRDINPGKQNDQVVEIKDGLSPGDVIVARGAYSLSQMQPGDSGSTQDAHAGHSH